MQKSDILVVEDDTDIRESLNDFLSYEGFRVATASNGLEALQYIEKHKHEGLPSLIFLDLMMPIMDGHGFLESLQQKHPDVRTPVIIFSAVAAVKESYNVVGFMKKPACLEEIVERARSYVHAPA